MSAPLFSSEIELPCAFPVGQQLETSEEIWRRGSGINKYTKNEELLWVDFKKKFIFQKKKKSLFQNKYMNRRHKPS